MKRRLLLLAVLAAGHAGAASLKLWPDDFRPDALPLHGETTTLLASSSPDMIQLVQAADPKTVWYGWAPVNLPVGTVMKGASYIHGGSDPGKFTSCVLARVKMGRPAEPIASGVGSSLNQSNVVMTVTAPARMTIEKGYVYFVRLFVSVGATARGAKIRY